MRVNNIKYIVEQKFRLRQLQRPYTTQAEPSFILLDQKEDKRRRLCSQPGCSMTYNTYHVLVFSLPWSPPWLSHLWWQWVWTH